MVVPLAEFFRGRKNFLAQLLVEALPVGENVVFRYRIAVHEVLRFEIQVVPIKLEANKLEQGPQMTLRVQAQRFELIEFYPIAVAGQGRSITPGVTVTQESFQQAVEVLLDVAGQGPPRGPTS